MKKIILLIILLIIVWFIVNSRTDETAEALVRVASHPTFGEILTASNGLTLYTKIEDSATESTCNDACAVNWPPVTSGDSEPTGSDDLPGQLGTLVREDGTTQVTYNDKPLYLWINDEAPGDTTGDGINDVWSVATP